MILAIPLRHFFLLPKTFNLFGFENIPDEGYSKNVLCTLNLISTFLFQLYYYLIQWKLSNPTHQGTREMFWIVQDVGILGFYFS